MRLIMAFGLGKTQGSAFCFCDKSGFGKSENYCDCVKKYSANTNKNFDGNAKQKAGMGLCRGNDRDWNTMGNGLEITVSLYISMKFAFKDCCCAKKKRLLLRHLRLQCNIQ